MKLGSCAGTGAGLGAGRGAGAGAEATGVATTGASAAVAAVSWRFSSAVLAGACAAEAAATGAEALIWGVATEAAVCAALAGTATAADAATVADAAGVTAADAGALAMFASGADVLMLTPGAEAVAALAGALPAGAAVAAEALTVLSSAMLRESSAKRVLAASSCFFRASSSSAFLRPCMAPLESVSLSGAVVLGRWSCTSVCTLPLAARPALATAALGAVLASLLRNWLKSRLCAAISCRASLAETAWACSLLGSCSTLPERRRFTLPSTKASGLCCSRATSIWSSETPAGRWAAARRPAVSPGRTVTVSLLPASGAGVAARGLRAGRGVGSVRVLAAEGAATCACSTFTGARTGAAAGAALRLCAAVVTLGAGLRSAGGSNSRV